MSSRFSPLLVLLAAVAPSLAHAVPGPEGTAITLQGGYRYVPNARFGELARASGHPLRGSSPGGPSIAGVFAYRWQPELEIAIDLGWNYERFDFEEGGSLVLNQFPIVVAARYYPLDGKLQPFLGAGIGYLLNFFTDRGGAGIESHGAGPFALAGAALTLNERWSVVAEYRLALSRAALPGLGSVQVGGNTIALGVQLSFPPDESRIQ